IHGGTLGKLVGDLRGSLSEFARVLPDGNGLGAERDAVEGRMVCILARYRHGSREALRLERGDSSAGGTVVRRHDRVDLVVVRGQELFGVALGVGREPAI